MPLDGTTQQGSFSSGGGIHYYQIDVTTPVIANIKIAIIVSVSTRERSLQLCDSNYDLIDSNTFGTEQSTKNISAHLRAGTYYAVVKTDNTAAYKISVATVVNNCDTSTSTEDTLEVDGGPKNGSLSTGELDYFQLDVTDDTLIDIEMNELSSTGFVSNNSLQLCDSSDGLISSDTFGESVSKTADTIRTFVRTGTYYIYVGSNGALSYRVSVATADDCDSSETAETTLMVDAAAHDGKLSAGDELHYFQIGPANDISVTIEAVFTHDNPDNSLQLCDGSDDLIDVSADSISALLIQGTSYYIVVGSSAPNDYMLTVEERDTDPPPPPTPPPPPRPDPPSPDPSPRASDTEAGGGGGCAISDQNEAVYDLLAAVASLMLIPVSVVIRRKIRSHIKT